ncbi:hypothetical protein STENOSP10_30230 [Stenotrophomonas sepilia]|uniref:Uncharacterized protein n=1 Tax=Stenotrophomonas sepilia TaxID=2860290 RepID=A0ABQ6QF60_9GAMM|nr:hypothetical protein STENOSP10_30230 [Stenotrophomonas sepilia]
MTSQNDPHALVSHIQKINEMCASHLPNIGDLTVVARADGINFIVEACAAQDGRYYRVSAATGEEACWDDCVGWATATSLREAVNRIRSAVLNGGALSVGLSF